MTKKCNWNCVKIFRTCCQCL